LRQVAQRFFFFFPSLSSASAASLSPSATELLRLLLLVAADKEEEAAAACQIKQLDNDKIDKIAMRKNVDKARRKLTSLFSKEGTGIAEEATGSDEDVPVIKDAELELLEATVVMEVGLLRPGLVELWLLLLVVGEGGCCFFFTA